jgi:hypothetical protein
LAGLLHSAPKFSSSDANFPSSEVSLRSIDAIFWSSAENSVSVLVRNDFHTGAQPADTANFCGAFVVIAVKCSDNAVPFTIREARFAFSELANLPMRKSAL